MTTEPRNSHVLEVLVFATAAAGLALLAALSEALVPRADRASLDLHAPPIEWRDRIYGVAAPEPAVLWLAGSGGKVLRSEDAGRSWKLQATGVSAGLQDIAAWDPKRAIAVGADGIILRTSDAGATWTEATSPVRGQGVKLLRVRIRHPRTAWAVGTFGTLLVSHDDGSSWEKRGDEMDVAWNDIAYLDELKLCIVGEFGRIRISPDAGDSWQDVATTGERSLMAVAFRDPRNGVAVGLDGAILATHDAGVSWLPVATTSREHLFAVAWDGDHWTAVGDMGVLATGAAEATQWTARRLAEHELGWHTSLTRYAGGLFLVGASQGTWNAGRWTLWNARS